MCISIEDAFTKLKKFLKRKDVQEHRSEILNQIRFDFQGLGINEEQIKEVLNG